MISASGCAAGIDGRRGHGAAGYLPTRVFSGPTKFSISNAFGASLQKPATGPDKQPDRVYSPMPWRADGSGCWQSYQTEGRIRMYSREWFNWIQSTWSSVPSFGNCYCCVSDKTRPGNSRQSRTQGKQSGCLFRVLLVSLLALALHDNAFGGSLFRFCLSPGNVAGRIIHNFSPYYFAHHLDLLVA